MINIEIIKETWIMYNQPVQLKFDFTQKYLREYGRISFICYKRNPCGE